MLLLIAFLSTLSKTALLTLLAVALGSYYVVYPQISKWYLERKLKKWSNTPKDVVILHAILRGRTLPNPSPFVMKLETYLRMAKINYEADMSILDAWGPKGRFPWISLNGQHLGDSTLIMELLKKKFEVKLGNEYSPKELALGAVIQRMVDNHTFWGVPYERFVWSSYQGLVKAMSSKVWWVGVWIYYKLWQRQVLQRAKGHGIGLHTKEEIQALISEDLKNLSELIGGNKYLLGEHPSEYDATVFGHLSSALWGVPGSELEKQMRNEFPILRDYCERIKETYYPDWDKILVK